MRQKQYTGIGLLGNETIGSIYAVNEGIVDINGTGIYHLFYKEYGHDLLQAAATMVRVGEHLYYGNRHWQKCSHPEHLKLVETAVEDYFRYCDTFYLEEEEITKRDTVYAYGKNRLVMETVLLNESQEEKEIALYGYCAVRNEQRIKSHLAADSIVIHTGKAQIGMVTKEATECYIIADSPTDFAYQTFLNVSRGEEQREAVETNTRLGAASGRSVTLLPGERLVYEWALLFADSEEELLKDMEEFRSENARQASAEYWEEWFQKGRERLDRERDLSYENLAYTNLAAMKAVCVNGYIPADLTGHYFHEKHPCYYARDSIMTARGFLLAGHYEECESILRYLMKRERKANGEFYQRYDGNGCPNEGANNEVRHQIDSIGYFLRIVYEYYSRTGKLLAEEALLEELIVVIEQSEKEQGMAGPEGGVNEGVYGPAFITSSNMFLYGGMAAAVELCGILGNRPLQKRCEAVCEELYAGILSTFDPQMGRYHYGYVSYHNHLVEKYDTPQYFGPLYGFPVNEQMRQTHAYFLKNASFYEDGIGYSEQEYHHGPWLFNTLACAEYCKITGDLEEYRKKMDWAVAHSNAYGLLPEAVDADQEERCFINPLTWACAEFVASYFRQ